MSKNLWRSLEVVQGLAALPSTWRELMGADYSAGQSVFLRATGRKGATFPCPRECGCWHEIIEHDEDDVVGICQCDPFCCNDLKLSASEIEIFDVNTAKLGRLIARAFGCEAKESKFDLGQTWQIGAFGGAALPVVLTIQSSADRLRNIVANLVAKLQKPFILLAPTNRFLEINSQSLLSMARAGFFDLESNLTLTPSGTLVARRSGGELFSLLLPDRPEEVGKGEAEKVIALVSKLRSERGNQKAPLFDVFNLLVLDGLTQKQAAAACGCTKGLMSLRVRELEERFGLSVEKLRGFASDVRERSSSVKGDEFRRASDGARADDGDEVDQEDAEG